MKRLVFPVIGLTLILAGYLSLATSSTSNAASSQTRAVVLVSVRVKLVVASSSRGLPIFVS